MINKVIAQNYKCFQNVEISLKNISVLAGGNACGKSSIIQILRYFNQLIYNSKWCIDTRIEDVDFGKADSIIGQSNDKNDINIEIGLSNEDVYNEYKFTLKVSDKNSYLFDVIGQHQKDFKKKFRLYYLNAERYSPHTLHEISNSAKYYVGSHGEYSISLLKTFNALLMTAKDYSIENLSEELRNKNNTFINVCNFWLSCIFENTQVFIDDVDNVPYNTLMLNNGGITCVPAATGFGISYCLPIVVQGLICSILKDGVFIVENPEAHLHPKGQSRMGKFLAELALSGVQVIIETHSEHVINGIRLVMGTSSNSSKANFIFFSHDEEGYKQQEITLNDKGELSQWPKGFFDQDEIDLRELLKRKIDR